MLHPKTKRDFERDLRNTKQSLTLLNAVSNVKVTTFSLMGGGYNCQLSLGMLPKNKQEDIIDYIEKLLLEHKEYLTHRLTEDKGEQNEK